MSTAVLETVNGPADLKPLVLADLTALAADLRQEIIRVLSRNGGHLATNLGSVELTLALHYVFDSPRDKLVWDVGNQCYTHKLITGRRASFATLRKAGGLSGFVNRRESPHDTATAGHAGTALSTALGWVSARDLLGDDYGVVAVVGDGALTAGLSYEALNNMASFRSQLLIVVSDNEYSISPTQGAVSTSLRRCKSRILDGGIFGPFGVTYWGPVDGHDIGLLVDVFREARTLHKPVVVHAVTVKGKGYPPAEQDPCRYHGVTGFDIETGQVHPSGKGPSYSDVFGEEMERIAEENPRVVAITAAMTTGTGLAGFAKRFPDRFFDVGIAEQHGVTFAGGLALGGAHPVVAIYSPFLQRSYDSVIHDVCLQDLPVTFVLDRAGLVGDDGPTHHGVLDLAYLRAVPNMTVAAPKDGSEFRAMLRWAVAHPAPAAIRIPRGEAPPSLTSPDGPVIIEAGRAELLRDGRDAGLFAIGSTVAPAVQAADELDKRGISCAVVNARFVKPLDDALLSDVAGRIRYAFTLEEHVRHGGFGSAILELLAARGVRTPVQLLALPDVFLEHDDSDHLRDRFGLSAARIVETVQATIAAGGPPAPGAPRLDPAALRAEMKSVADRPLPTDLESWVQRYASVGHRASFLWHWCLKGVELTCLPCVDPDRRDSNNVTKVLGVMFDVLLDDVADHAQDARFLEILLAIPHRGPDFDSLAPRQQPYAQLAADVWQAIQDRVQRYPRYAEFADLLRFDYLQLLNAMRYSWLLNQAPHAINLTEHDLYLPHNMHMMVSGTMDLMCSTGFDRAELGRVRTLLWNAQCMGRVGNLTTTWEREVKERDFSSGVFALALEKSVLTPQDLRQGDPEELKRRIRGHHCEEYFQARWQQHRERVHSMVGQIRSFEVTGLLQGLERLWQLHQGSRGLK